MRAKEVKKKEAATPDQLKKDILNGIIIGLLLLLISLVNTYISISHLHLKGIKLSYHFFQIMFILLCILGMFKKSRIAVIGISLYILIAKILKVAVAGSLNLPEIIISMIFIYFFYKATVAVFKFHKLKTESRGHSG